MKLISWIKSFFGSHVQDEPQDKLNRKWLEMRRAILEHDRQEAITEAAGYRIKLSKSRKTDARRGAWQQELERAVAKQMKAENALYELDLNEWRKAGAL